MKPKSDKRREADEPWLKVRYDFKARRTCAMCDRQACDVHEIAAGTANRPKAFRERCCWLALCRDCHEEITIDPYWTLPRQMVLKAVSDPDGLDIPKVLDIMGLAKTALTLIDLVGEAGHMGSIGVLDGWLDIYERGKKVGPDKWYRIPHPK